MPPLHRRSPLLPHKTMHHHHHHKNQVRCLNEDVEGSCRNVFRPWDERTAPVAQPLRSDADDPELLLHIP